jgi:hypothetical protein
MIHAGIGEIFSRPTGVAHRHCILHGRTQPGNHAQTNTPPPLDGTQRARSRLRRALLSRLVPWESGAAARVRGAPGGADMPKQTTRAQFELLESVAVTPDARPGVPEQVGAGVPVAEDPGVVPGRAELSVVPAGDPAGTLIRMGPSCPLVGELPRIVPE